MPTVYKVLGQSNPSATTATTLYTAPALTSTVVSTITIANLSASSATYRIAIRPGGAVLSNSQYIVYDAAISANNTTALTLGITLAASDIVTVYSSTSTLTFSAFGSEIS